MNRDPTTIDWMKAQGSYTRSVFDSIAPRAEYLRKLSAFGASFGLVRSVQPAGNMLEDADIAAFVFWRAGIAAWQPRK